MKLVVINKKDNVAIAISDLKKGSVVEIGNKNITIKEKIPTGHKFTIRKIQNGEDIIKYGFSIGKAAGDIFIGEQD